MAYASVTETVPATAAWGRRTVLPAVMAALLVACGATSSSPSPVPSLPSSEPPAAGPIVIDTDMGADDILAIAMLVDAPSIEVRAITVAGTGLAHCAAGLRNLRGLLHQLGADTIPIGCGPEDAGPDERPFPDEWRGGTDAAYGLDLPPIPSDRAGADAVELLREVLAGAEAPMTVVVLGPWTNLEAVLAADPSMASRIAGLHVMGGALDAPGNVFDEQGEPMQPSLEWNLAADPSAVSSVLELGIPVSLVALDATDQLPVDRALYEALDADHAAAGRNLAFELLTKNGYLLEGGTFLWDQLAAATYLDPSLVTWEAVRIAVDERGHLERRSDGAPVEVSTGVDPPTATAAVLAALGTGTTRPDHFELDGELTVSWDGTSCALHDPVGPAGTYRLAIDNRTDAIAQILLISVAAPHTWDELRDIVAGIEDPVTVEPPDWIGVAAGSEPGPRGNQTAIAQLQAGLYGPVCITEVADGSFTFVAGEPVTVTAP
jgi:pyrimidine-specific ribonucleoside hydrolase